MADEFQAYLKELDKANGNFTLQTYFHFSQKCQELRGGQTKKEALLKFIGNEFFTNTNRQKRLALRNPVTRDECKKYLQEDHPNADSIPQHLWDAEIEVQRHLADHYQNFLKKRYQERNNSLTACLL